MQLNCFWSLQLFARCLNIATVAPDVSSGENLELNSDST